MKECRLKDISSCIHETSHPGARVFMGEKDIECDSDCAWFVNDNPAKPDSGNCAIRILAEGVINP